MYKTRKIIPTLLCVSSYFYGRNIYSLSQASKNQAYQHSKIYWEKQENTYDGVMGGYAHLNDYDIRDSQIFFDSIKEKKQIKVKKVLELGAGIGRVSTQFLAKNFQEIHIVEQNSTYTDTAKLELEKLQNNFQIFNSGILEFNTKEKYDCIWIQWVSLYVTDQDLFQLISKLKQNIETNGILVLKENISVSDYVIDQTDSSVTRSEAVYKNLFQKAGYDLLEEKFQEDFPDEIFPVKMFCFQVQQ